MTEFGPESLRIDEAAETARIGEGIRSYLRAVRRKGTIVAVSGGIDSECGRRAMCTCPRT